MNKIEKYLRDSDKLFKEWKNKEPSGTINHRDSVFIRDGVVCPEIWFSSEIRPLFLLKEAYGDNEDWDLIDKQLLNGESSISKMWCRVAHWTQGLLSATDNDFMPFSKYEGGIYKDDKYLKRIAVVNVKKSNGKKESDWDNLKEYAKYDKKELFDQIKLCDPTIIICGYTGQYLDIIADEPVRSEWNENYFYYMTINNHDVLVIDYWHPANQYPDLLNYYGLMSIYQLALKNKKATK